LLLLVTNVHRHTDSQTGRKDSPSGGLKSRTLPLQARRGSGSCAALLDLCSFSEWFFILGGRHGALRSATAFWPKFFAASFAACFVFRPLTGKMINVRKRICATNTKHGGLRRKKIERGADSSASLPKVCENVQSRQQRLIRRGHDNMNFNISH